MLFRLSMAWGVPVRVLEDRLTADELEDYTAFYQVEPWGCAPQDQRTALLAYTTCKSMTGKGQFGDFVPRWSKPEPVAYSVWADQFSAFAAGHNARLKTT